MRPRGFTLIEVMVALLVIALGVGALLSTLVTAADTVLYLREKSFAQWIAFNRLSELRLNAAGQASLSGGASAMPAVGVTSDSLEYAGMRWQRVQQVTDPGIEGLLRVDVSVALLPGAASGADSAAQDDEEPEDLPMLARAIGFIGTAMGRPNGINPDWNPTAAGEGGPGGGGGRGGGGGGGGGGDGGGGGGGSGGIPGGGSGGIPGGGGGP